MIAGARGVERYGVHEPHRIAPARLERESLESSPTKSPLTAPENADGSENAPRSAGRSTKRELAQRATVTTRPSPSARTK
jgi:hypothetical protein